MMNRHHPTLDIAIVGMSALFPGAKDLKTYWQNILNKVYAIQEGAEDWTRNYFEANARETNRIYNNKGGFIGELAEFNPLEFGIMPNSVDGGEPVHFLALKLAQAALQDAGYLERPFNQEKTGIILGRGTYVNRAYNSLMQHGLGIDQTLDLIRQLLPTLDEGLLGEIAQELKASLPPFTAEMAPGLSPNILTGRIANRFDFHGPNYIIDAACASSLIAVQLAIEELSSGRCDMMLTGGAQASTPPQINMIFCRLGALSHGDIRPFSQQAEGTLLSEGLGILVLKRLEDAQRDGDRIYAVIKGVGIASDGKGLGMLAPRLEGEVLAIQRAYQKSGISPHTITLVEAHGTGIPLGDRTEIQSLSQIFGRRQGHLPSCALGSVKSMIGHCLPAAGAASLIKTALALYQKILPPTLCDEINPELNIEKSQFYLNTEARPWIHGEREFPRRAGVNAFGFGGINAHAILEEYPGGQGQPIQQIHHQWPSELLTVTAQERETLMEKVKQLADFLQRYPQTSLASLACTLSQSPFGRYRLAIVARDIADLQKKLLQVADKLAETTRTKLQSHNGIYFAFDSDLATPQRTAFMFPGEGSQYSNMLADLCLHFPQVRGWFDFLDGTFGPQRDVAPSSFIFPPATSLTPEQRQWAEQQLFNMDLGSETVVTASLALHELLQLLDVKAEVMLGHSSGENTALIASGIVRLSSREQLGEKMRYLNQIYQQLVDQDRIPKGVLLAVGAIAPEILQQLIEASEGQLHLAMSNCPHQSILFGSSHHIDMAVEQIQEAGGIANGLPFDRAYHTPLFDEVSQAFRAFYDILELGVGDTKLYSCVTGEVFPQEPEAIREVAARQWSSPVHFWETIDNLYQRGIRTFVEVGPNNNLTGFVKDILRNRDHLALASNLQRGSALTQLQQMLACLFVNGAEMNLSVLYQQRELETLDLDGHRRETEGEKPRHLLDLTMPIMSLSPELVRRIHERLQFNHPQTAKYSSAETDNQEIAEASSQSLSPLEETSAASSATTVSSQNLELSEDISQQPIPTAHFPDRSEEQRQASTSPTPTMGTHFPSVAASAPNTNLPLESDDKLAKNVQNAPDISRLSLLYNHFDLMQKFLNSQGRIANAIFSERGEKDERDGIARNILFPSLVEQGYSSTWTETWPLLGQIIKQDENYLYCERCFTLEEDIFLEDHTIGSQLSQHYRELIPLPVIPFTLTMEILAEAASYLAGGHQQVVAMEELRGYRWLALDREELVVGIDARLLSNSEPGFSTVKVRLFQLNALEEASPSLVFEGIVKLAPEFANTPSPLPFYLDRSASSRWSDEELYSTGMFHGPRFQGVKHLIRWGQQGIEADLQVIPRDNFFRSSQNPRFQIDAGLLDAAGQLVAYWISEQSNMDFHVFPFRIEAFYQYQKSLPPGSKVLCRGIIGFINAQQVTASFDLLNTSGVVIARLEGWQDLFFKVPSKYFQCRMFPQTAYLSEPWSEIDPPHIGRYISPFPEGFMEGFGSILQRILAHLVLNAQEREFWYNLPPNQRNDWLLKTITVKDLLRQWAQQKFKLDLAPVDVQILSYSSNKPVLYCRELEVLTPLPHISISYHHENIVAYF